MLISLKPSHSSQIQVYLLKIQSLSSPSSSPTTPIPLPIAPFNHLKLQFNFQPSTTPPLLIYRRLQRPTSHTNDSHLILNPLPTRDLSFPSPLIAFQKDIQSTRNPNPHYTCLSYHRLLSLHYAFV